MPPNALPEPPPPPSGWKLTAFAGLLNLAHKTDGTLVIEHADRCVAVSRALLDQLAKSPHLRCNGDRLTFIGLDADDVPCSVIYDRVGFDPTSHPALNEGGFHLLQRVEQEIA